MSINGIAEEPIEKVAVVLARHQETLEDHERRITVIESDRRTESQAFRNFTFTLYVQIFLFILNLIVTLFREAGR